MRCRSRVEAPLLPCFTPAFVAELEVGQERLTRSDCDDPLVNGDLLEDEAQDLVPL